MATDVQAPLLRYIHAVAAAAIVSGVWLQRMEAAPAAPSLLFMGMMVFVLAPAVFGSMIQMLGRVLAYVVVTFQDAVLGDALADWLVELGLIGWFILRTLLLLYAVHLTYGFVFPDGFA